MNKNSTCKTAALTLLASTIVFLASVSSATAQFFASNGRIYTTTRQFVVGGTVSLSRQQFVLDSDIEKYNQLHVSMLGISAGLMVGNKYGLLKGTLGLSYAGEKVPYSMDGMEANIVGNLFPMRFGSQMHRVEPYVLIAVKAFRTSIFGLEDPSSNRSVSTEQLLGRVTTTQIVAGLGLAYNILNDRNFLVQMFGQAGYGYCLSSTSTNSQFRNTSPSSPLLFSIGTNFGTRR